MKFSYYPGCTLKGSAQELDESFRSVCNKIGVSLSEIPDWTCCGASSAHMVDAFLEAALPARDLMTAERIGNDVVAPCRGLSCEDEGRLQANYGGKRASR